MRTVIILGALAAIFTGAAPAAACSVGDDYRVPTNLEMTREAETILLARVVGGKWDEENPMAGNSLTIRPITALKGAMPDGDFQIAGVAPLPEPRFLTLSNPYEFEGAHPLSYIGGCIRYMFPRGTTALFFLSQEEGQWLPSGGPFSRWAEDVPGPEAPWVELVRLYARAAGLPEAEGRAALQSERDVLAARQEDPVAQLMAADIERQLAGPNEPWNEIMRRQMGLMGFDDEAEAEGAADSIDATLDAMRADPAEED